MAFNPFTPVNEANGSLNAEARAMASMLSRGRFRSTILDVQSVNAGQTAQQPFAITAGVGIAGGAEAGIVAATLEAGFNMIITGMNWDYDPGVDPATNLPNVNNWVQGDGQLIFSLLVDGLHVAGYTSIPTRLGSLTSRDKLDRGVPVLAGQTVAVVYLHNGFAGNVPIITTNASVVAGIYGVKFPWR